MARAQRALRAALALIAALAVIMGWFVLRTGRDEPLPVYWAAPDFALVNQNGDTLRGRELALRSLPTGEAT